MLIAKISLGPRVKLLVCPRRGPAAWDSARGPLGSITPPGGDVKTRTVDVGAATPTSSLQLSFDSDMAMLWKQNREMDKRSDKKRAHFEAVKYPMRRQSRPATASHSIRQQRAFRIASRANTPLSKNQAPPIRDIARTKGRRVFVSPSGTHQPEIPIQPKNEQSTVAYAVPKPVEQKNAAPTTTTPLSSVMVFTSPPGGALDPNGPLNKSVPIPSTTGQVLTTVGDGTAQWGGRWNVVAICNGI